MAKHRLTLPHPRLKRWTTEHLTGTVTIPRWHWAAYLFVFWLTGIITVVGWINHLVIMLGN